MKLLHLFTIILISSLGLSGIATSQTPQDRDRIDIPERFGSNIANFRFAQPGDLTMFVSVWGSVGRSGRYEIPIGTDIGQLLSLAGGPGADLRGFEGPDIRGGMGRGAEQGRTIVRLSRMQGEGREIIMELRIDDLLRLREDKVPLKDGDIIMIDQIRQFRVWDMLGVVGSVATIILLVDRFIPIFGD